MFGAIVKPVTTCNYDIQQKNLHQKDHWKNFTNSVNIDLSGSELLERASISTYRNTSHPLVRIKQLYKM